MCVTTKLQQHIRNLTNDGEVVARFLVDTVQGKTPGTKACHQMEALKYLDRYGFSDDANQEESQFWGLIPTPEELAAQNNTPSPSMGEEPAPSEGRGWDGGEGETENSKLKTQNSLDILNYEIAHLIRQETAEGHTIVQFLAHTMTGSDRPYTPKNLRIKPADRMAASREILRRGYGHFGRKRKLVVDDHDDTNDYDTLHTDLAKRMREYSEHGTDAVRFLLDVMEDADPDAGFTWNHRVSAAQELIRRGWDTNYDNITPEMLQDYWRNQHSPLDAIRESKDLEAASPIENSPLPLRGRAREGAPTPESSQSKNSDGRGKAELNSPLPRGEGWGEGEISLQRIAPNNATIPTRHSHETKDLEAASPPDNSPLPPRGRAREGATTPEPSQSKNPDGRGKAELKPPLPRGEGWGEGEIPLQRITPNNEAVPTYHSADNAPAESSVWDAAEGKTENSQLKTQNSPDTPDCFYEPLTPDQQAIFDYQELLESGEFREGEISMVPPSEAARKAYRDTLAFMTEAAAAEGVPLLPNPLARTLRHPTIRGP